MILFNIVAKFIHFLYGYEGINILLKLAPSRIIINILREFGAKIGQNVRIQAPLIIHNADKLYPIYQNLTIGNECYIGRDCIIDLMGKVEIQSNSTLSHRVILNTHTNAGKSPLKNEHLKTTQGDIYIGSGAYIGTGVMILENVEVGENTIIGALSLVNRSIPPNSKAYGLPCRVQETLNDN